MQFKQGLSQICHQVKVFFREQHCSWSFEQDTQLQFINKINQFVNSPNMIMLNCYRNPILLGQYGLDHSSRLERVQQNQFNFYINTFHCECFIELSIKSNYVPVILLKLKDDSWGIELIFLGYISPPSEDYDPDALLQQILCEILNPKEESKKLDISQEIIITYYQDDL
ncbi:unnamed protein product [Paramecium octaurelia]|uniref:Uncharacterized protein n=1 Tax=Paramecium octaurelia TaxID=43137 RepID=A0A8S1T0X9_PAROT|nr:unnamed protein product [Paramecium octaurelia]